MVASRYAVVSGGVVTNVVLWDAADSPTWTPGPGNTAVEIPTGVSPVPGWNYDGSTFTVGAFAPTVRESLLSKVNAAMNSNQTFLALGAPTNAQLSAQVTSLTRQVNALIRMVAEQLDSTTGT